MRDTYRLAARPGEPSRLTELIRRQLAEKVVGAPCLSHIYIIISLYNTRRPSMALDAVADALGIPRAPRLARGPPTGRAC